MRCLQLQSIRISQRVNKLYGVVTRSEGWPDFRAVASKDSRRVSGAGRAGDGDAGRKDNCQFTQFGITHTQGRISGLRLRSNLPRELVSKTVCIIKLTHVCNFATLLTNISLNYTFVNGWLAVTLLVKFVEIPSLTHSVLISFLIIS